MDDTISRQEAIKAIEAYFGDLPIKGHYDMLQLIKQLPSAQPEPRWIPVTERLPDDETDILVTYVDGEETRIIPVNYGRGTWFDCIFNRALNPFKITAWMPFPESYRGGKDE